MSVVTYSQEQGDMAIGGNLVIGMKSGNLSNHTNIGIGAKFFYNVTDPIRLAVEFDYLLKNPSTKGGSTSWWDFSVYGHYLCPVADKVMVYPTIGLGMVGFTSKINSYPDFAGSTYSDSFFAVSLGGGIDYALSSNLILNGEFKIKFFDNSNRINLAIGLTYKF